MPTPKLPPINQPVMFNTPEADAILSALEVYPPDNPWNQIITDWPVHPNSRNIVASVLGLVCLGRDQVVAAWRRRLIPGKPK